MVSKVFKVPKDCMIAFLLCCLRMGTEMLVSELTSENLFKFYFL